MAALAVAALSARVLAQAASRDGFDVVALDVFGDSDTLRASSRWMPLASPGALQIDPEQLLVALAELAQRGDVIGWIAGSGFEAAPELLERGAALLPLIGTPADAVRRVRGPQSFFERLAHAGIAHPQVRMTPPLQSAGWLSKDAGSSGGWHIRRVTEDDVERAGPESGPAAAPAGPSTQGYYQREMTGVPMSATFIANGTDACVLGVNQQIVRPLGARPFVFCGVIGPVPVPADVSQHIGSVLRRLVAAFSLRGLGSLDFMVDDTGAVHVLEINPRPPASLALYATRCAAASSPASASVGVIAAHVRACLDRELPDLSQAAAGDLVQGTEIVFATRPLRLDDAGALRLAGLAGCHDLPRAASRFSVGDPVCSVSAEGATAAEVRDRLDCGRDGVHQLLEALR
ncbi:MAG: ATP-grasp domain-containing protein [Burkholderiaceae bacterium]